MVQKHKSILRWVVKTLFFLLLQSACLLLAAGRLDWITGWVFIAMNGAIQLVNALVLIPHRPELIAERSSFKEGTKTWDLPLVIVQAIAGPLLLALIAGLDVRFGWSPAISPILQAVAVVVAFPAAVFTTWAMYANIFFSGTVRIQKERSHQVVSGGPYRLVRHPGYAGGLFYNLAAPLALASLWAFLPAAIIIAVTFIRTSLEDRTLQEELPGYTEYAARVRHRLLPGIW
jgi:protein-S-isoprenylcysteine O-methyltransferase Ste14